MFPLPREETERFGRGGSGGGTRNRGLEGWKEKGKGGKKDSSNFS